MAENTVFVMDGIPYHINVLSLSRKFSVLDTEHSGRTQNGEMYRDVIGTFYNYTMTIGERFGDAAALEAFWKAISSPVVSHLCQFPYGQTTLTQRMYITGGEQALMRMDGGRNHWGEVTVNFIAMEPEVTP